MRKATKVGKQRCLTLVVFWSGLKIDTNCFLQDQ